MEQGNSMMSLTTSAYLKSDRVNTSPMSFMSFMLKAKINRRFGQISLIGTITQLIIFKILYPFPDFISDSFSYIATNIYKMKVNLWPIGYSKFLLAIHFISHSDTFLVTIQYFLLQASLLYFFYTILFLFLPSKTNSIFLFICLLFNPMFIYLSNCVLSDALFAAITVVFLTQLLWMLHYPKLSNVIIQGLLVGLAFTIRYTAIYYPLISIFALFLSRYRILFKLLGSFLGIILMFVFYRYTQQKTKEVTGTAQFSVFGGWQLANNALYMYDHIKVDTNRLPPTTIELDRMVREFYKAVPPQYRDFGPFPGTYFIKVPYAVLKPFMSARYEIDDPVSQFKAWGMVSPIYEEYGSYLVRHYPLSFAKYYLWLNIKNYLKPHLEKFGDYNLRLDNVPQNVQDWFDYTTPDVHSVSKTFQGKLFYIFPTLFMVLNFYLVGLLIWLFSTNKFKTLTIQFRLTLILIIIFIFLNFCFSIFATPIVLRYQAIPLLILLTFVMLLSEMPRRIIQQ